MKWAIIGTWRMSFEGLEKASKKLSAKAKAEDAIIDAVTTVEDNKKYVSVGYGGLPNKYGKVQLDAGYMNGNTGLFGAVGSLEGIKNPIKVAKKLSTEKYNNFLVGQGAYDYAIKNGFKTRKNETKESLEKYQARLLEDNSELKSYDGHDTVCFIAKDEYGQIVSATSTSGLFMKENGRVGDSPIPGAGYYVDSFIGGASATGLGEDIIKCVLSYELISRMAQGIKPMQAAQETINDMSKRLTEKQGYANNMSIICLDKHGNYGVGTNCKFAFTYASDEKKARTYIAEPKYGTVILREAGDADLDVD